MIYNYNFYIYDAIMYDCYHTKPTEYGCICLIKSDIYTSCVQPYSNTSKKAYTDNITLYTDNIILFIDKIISFTE